MAEKSVEQTPSKTALFTAMRRALANMRYQDDRFGPDNLALVFLPALHRFLLKSRSIQERTWNRLAAAMPGMNEYIIARTAFFDRLFLAALKERIPQIVLLGAGYDSRAYRFAEYIHDTIIFELDAAPTQNRKIKCLQAAGIKIPPEVQYIPIDFAAESLADALALSGYSQRERTLFLWEGVSYYLQRPAVAATLAFAGRCEKRDSLIAFDICDAVTPDTPGTVYGAADFLNAMQAYHTDEGLLFTARAGEMETILAESNLKMTQYLDAEAIEREYLMDERGVSIGRMLGLFRFVCAAPAI